MIKFFIFFVLGAVSISSFAIDNREQDDAVVESANERPVGTNAHIADMQLRTADTTAVTEDLRLILEKARLANDAVKFSWDEERANQSKIAERPSVNPQQLNTPDKLAPPKKSTVKIECTSQKIQLKIDSPKEEWAATFYYGLQKLGFLFPHPRIQISPTSAQMKLACEKTFEWKPRFKYRGFHFHTMHPSEWLYGFLMNQPVIAQDTLRWLARNGQNLAQIILVEQDDAEIARQLEPLIKFGHTLGVSFGIDVSFNLIQQRAYRLIGKHSKLRALGLLPGNRKKEIRSSIENLNQLLSFDFMTIELGSSEFTSSGYQRTIDWINTADTALRLANRSLFIKVHASAGMVDKKYGNFNFIPQYTHTTVGVLPHTVMYFGLGDKSAPVYGRKDFGSMAEFTKKEAPLRPTWYYPETSYFIGMDIDVPIFLTDYLLARSDDMDLVESWGVNGHLNFSTGQELGYWLKDWTVALLANADYRGNPYIGLELLGESHDVWKAIADYQHTYFKGHALLEELSSASLLDEVPFVGFVIHDRTIFRELRRKPALLKERIVILREAVEKAPDLSGVKNLELLTLLEVTQLRLQQALALREALLEVAEGHRDSDKYKIAMARSVQVRELATKKMLEVKTKWNRYPEAHIFDKNENLSSYPYGYGWPAATLHFWEREEKMIEENTYWPWFMNIYSLKRILL